MSEGRDIGGKPLREHPTHPLDAHISSVRDRAIRLLMPEPGQWWRSTDREPESATWRATLDALLAVRKGGRLGDAVASLRERPDLSADARHDAELKVYHFCRLAGLMPREPK